MAIGLTDNVAPLGDFPIVEDSYVKGGLRVVPDLATRDAISDSSRKEGMLVVVTENLTTWQLGADLVTWFPYVATGPASGDLAGFYPDPTVGGIQGVPVSTNDVRPLTEGDLLTFKSGAWVNEVAPRSVGTIETLVFRPYLDISEESPAPDGRTYNSWTTLMEARANIPGPVRIYVDLMDTGEIPGDGYPIEPSPEGGIWNMANTILCGRNLQSGIRLQRGVGFSDLIRLEGFALHVEGRFDGDPQPLIYTDTPQLTLVASELSRSMTVAQPGSTIPIQWASGKVHLLEGSVVRFVNLGEAEVSVFQGAGVHVYCEEGSTIEQHTMAGPLSFGGVLTINIGPFCTVSREQTGIVSYVEVVGPQPYPILIFAPGSESTGGDPFGGLLAPSGPNVYSDWAELMMARQRIPGPLTIVVDPAGYTGGSSYGIAIPPGPDEGVWDMTGITLRGINAAGTSILLNYDTGLANLEKIENLTLAMEGRAEMVVPALSAFIWVPSEMNMGQLIKWPSPILLELKNANLVRTPILHNPETWVHSYVPVQTDGALITLLEHSSIMTESTETGSNAVVKGTSVMAIIECLGWNVIGNYALDGFGPGLSVHIGPFAEVSRTQQGVVNYTDASGFTAAGDLEGSNASQVVVGLRGVPLAPTLSGDTGSVLTLDSDGKLVLQDPAGALFNAHTYQLSAGSVSTNLPSSTPQVIGATYFNPTSLVTGHTRQVVFRAIIETSNSAYPVHIQLYDRSGISTAGVGLIASSHFDRSSTTATYCEVDISDSFTAPTIAGVLECYLWIAGPQTEYVTCTMARIDVSWV